MKCSVGEDFDEVDDDADLEDIDQQEVRIMDNERHKI